jgi:glucose/arabinose dehydrogenase
MAILLAACNAEEPAPPSTPTSASPSTSSTTTPPPAQPDLARVRIQLIHIATLDQPLAMAIRDGDPALYIAEKTGAVIPIRDGKVDQTPVLDIGGSVSLGSEQGLLGLAFAPDGRTLFINYTDTNGDTHVTSFAMKDGRADPSTARDLLVVPQPYSNHNGGNLVFGPDGYLYIGLGDGGSGGDPHGNGQSRSTLLGKMLRIDPTPRADRPYAIPPDNPFVDQEGTRPEIWALGLRNPWRYSFDRATGDLWIGDVGQSAWEEIDRQPAGRGGENYGWNVMEGDHAYSGAPAPPNLVAPVYEYSHDGGGCSVTGGYVYRGEAIPDLAGAYLFGDFCIGRLEALRFADGKMRGYRELGPTVPSLSSFGEDADGELYALSLSGGVFRLAHGS